MINFKGKMLTATDKKVLRQFSKYCFEILKYSDDKANITVRFVVLSELNILDKKELKEYGGWVDYYKYNSKKYYTITLDGASINKRAKQPMNRLEDALLSLGHELVHIKQYVKNELFDYANDDVRYKGKRYTKWQEDEDYYFSGWEIEAYGYELGLFRCFKKRFYSSIV